MISWAIFGTLGGIVLITRLGTVAVWVGWVLIAIGLFRAYQLVQSFLHPAGTIVVSEKQVSLPIGLHRAHPIEVTPADVTAVYFLRRSVPLYHAAPVLVVELGSRALLFPRDWFASEADQRHIVHALLSQRRDLVPESASGHDGVKAQVEIVQIPTRLRASGAKEMVVGTLLFVIGFGEAFINVHAYRHGPMSLALIVLGGLLVWRGRSQRY